MISEKQFATRFLGFWNECLPFLTAETVEGLNVDAEPLRRGARRWMRPLPVPENASNNDWIAETAFGLFAEAQKSDRSVLEVSNDKGLLTRVGKSALKRITGLRGVWSTEVEDLTSPSDQAIELALRLETYFGQRGICEITVQPYFRGCGIVDSCYGDIFAKGCLYEIKTVDRNLRSADIRQVLLYCALNRYSQDYPITRFVILNPRRGLEYSFNIEEFSEQISGKTAAELFHEIVDFLSSYEGLHMAS